MQTTVLSMVSFFMILDKLKYSRFQRSKHIDFFLKFINVKLWYMFQEPIIISVNINQTLLRIDIISVVIMQQSYRDFNK